MQFDLKHGDNVKIMRNVYGREVEFEGKLIHCIFEFAADPCWWVEMFINGNREVEVYHVSDIMAWNKPKRSLCECGGFALGHPGHSPWCRCFTS